MKLIDSHYHLDFIREEKLLPLLWQALRARGMALVGQSVLPSSYRAMEKQVEGVQKDFLSLGFHPWYIESRDQADRELAIFQEALPGTRLIGEIGLDFAPRRLEKAGEDLQTYVFTEILAMVREEAKRMAQARGEEAGPPLVLSVHGVKSAGRVLDLLEDFRLFSVDVKPIIHYFSGTSDELTRNIRLGGHISVNQWMLQGKRGRAYVKQIPGDRILLESDYPEGKILAQSTLTLQEQAEGIAQDLEKVLSHTLATISQIRGEDMEAVLQKTQEKLYPWP